jgi:peptidoglycan/xylan/chitin deacetylase (PgdA/CDA1 family)
MSQFHRAPSCLVLLYHRIGPCGADPHGICVSAENFRSHVQVLTESCRLLSLDEFEVASARGNFPSRSAMITFDDGYAAAVDAAIPQLRCAAVPAVFFIASAYVGLNREFWWDELLRVVTEADARLLPSMLAVADGPQREEVNNREDAYAALFANLKLAPHPLRRRMLEQLRDVSGVPFKVRPEYAPVSAAQVRDAAAVPGIAIGGHSHHHDRLTTLPASVQREDVAACRARLEAIADRPVHAFAYPYGCPGLDFDDASIRAVEAAGYTLAFAAYPPPGALPGRFTLARQHIFNVPHEAFRQFIERWWQ